MRAPFRRLGAAFAGALLGTTTQANPAPPPAALFFTAPDLSEPVLSPDGSALAVLVRNAQGRRQLAVLETANPTKATIAASFTDVDVRAPLWVDGTRLVFKLGTGSDIDAGEAGSGLMAVDRDGSNLKLLVMRKDNVLMAVPGGSIARPLANDHRLLRTLSDGSGDVIVARPAHSGLSANADWRLTGTTPLRLNTRNGHVAEVASGAWPANAVQWAIDDKGVARWALARDADTVTFHEGDGKGAWQARAKVHVEGQAHAEGDFIRAAVDGNTYLAHATSATDATLALYRLDPKSGGPEALPMVALKGYDVGGELVESAADHKVLGLRYVSDAVGTAWFDPTFKALQAKLDAELPGRVNVIEPAGCGCSKTALLTSWSGRQPAQYFLVAVADGSLTPLGGSRPAIVAREMAATEFQRVKTRDGRELPVYVTKPAGKGPWPAVVLVHGGAWERGWDWRWDAPSQFLASRGFLVVKPEVRGSRGYGQQWFEAGFGQWGGGVLDDVDDAARWAASQGLADAGRICVAGPDVGGLATLLALARSPDLYRCGAAWSPVSDIDRVLATTWPEATDRQQAYGLATLMGTAASAAAASPVALAGHITHPLLLADGFEDDARTLAATRAIRGRLESRHVPVSLLAYPGEGHEFGLPATRVTFYDQLAAFLATNLAPTAEGGSR